ncbi:MAG: hypothetical protein ACFE0Q_20820 [Anaerolineae bacterium]
MADGLVMNVDTRRMQQIINSLPGAANDLLAGVATEMVSDIKLSMVNSPATGITYRRRSVEHTSSSPGNPPRPDTGELMGSITHRQTGDLEQTIHDQVEYGVYQELGTEFIEARPFMSPVFDQWRVGGFADFVRSYPLVT